MKKKRIRKPKPRTTRHTTPRKQKNVARRVGLYLPRCKVTK